MENQINIDFKKSLLDKSTELSLWEENVEIGSYKTFKDVLYAHAIVLEQISEREKQLNQQLAEIESYLEITNDCDRWDYIFSGTAGFLAGLVDIFLVGSPDDSKLIGSADEFTNNLVERFARLNGWNGAKSNSDSTKSAIGFLERKFKVNYDHRHSTDVSGTFNMSPSNHHLKSLAHSPSPIGLIFSIIDQFKGTATFLDNGYLITIDSESKLQGHNLPSKIFAAFCNWIGHIMSDIAGSSGASGRGSGVAIPFFELLLSLNIGKFNMGEEKKTLADIAVKIFEKGYDLRFGIAQSIPVVMVELFIRFFCILRFRFEYNRSWRDCMKFLNFDSSPKLRKMLLVGQGTLCLLDGTDALIRSKFGQDWITFFSRLNFVAWARLSYLGLRHSVSILTNEIELQRYEMRAKELGKYVDNVSILVEKFNIEHNRKLNKFFRERKLELDSLFNSLESNIKSNNHIGTTQDIGKIGSLYGFENRFNTLDEFERYMMQDDS